MVSVLQLASHLGLLFFALCLPFAAAATPNQFHSNPYQQITFAQFSAFVLDKFSPDITLSTVLFLLFSVTENHDLLSLHANQQSSESVHRIATGWLRAFTNGIYNKVVQDNTVLLKLADRQLDKQGEIKTLCYKLDLFIKMLNLYPVTSKVVNRKVKQKFQGRLNPISKNSFQPIYFICPQTVICQTTTCPKNPLTQYTKADSIPTVTLVKDFQIYENAQVLSAHCDICRTIYYADHESFVKPDGAKERVYLNDAPYLKLGSNIWVDRLCSKAVVNAVYNFHASTSAYSEFWNSTFVQSHHKKAKLSFPQVWQCFVQETVRVVAAASDKTLILEDKIRIKDITKGAYEMLGANGVISAATGHECSECSQPYRATPDVISGDGSEIVGMDVNAGVAPPSTNTTTVQPDGDIEMEDGTVEQGLVKMVVVDGIVMGPKHCAFGDGQCNEELENARGGAFCSYHHWLQGHKCRIVGCRNAIVGNTQACDDHQNEWKNFQTHRKKQDQSGFRRALRRSENNLEWLPESLRGRQPHDEPATETARKNYFTAPHFYCVETICAPCGVVIAWAKFTKSESPTNILHFLETVFPTPESKPSYIAIDKGCLVMKHAIAQNKWDTWKDTTRFIVDSYHYINHRVSDVFCRNWCNPAPANGSAPNLVIVGEHNGLQYYKRAFNTQACEQLNAWLGGFELILKKMTISNFNWFLHAMLFYHTQHILKKQQAQADNVVVQGEGEDGVVI
ncbi:hypothetical protein BDN72DRAFT_781447 [Pluteus cervinus]|uniref:Uncharacterized protein n=1 Tax=Pluteus cervinus TaxID=181527 RepID=A0ACD2ZZ89_9AGAR|nr:hypothetical protein BDN72DRAFT_781447 [Pluteus cervinus]